MRERRDSGSDREQDSNEAVRNELETRLKALARDDGGVDPKEISATVESVMSTVEGDLSAVNLKLYAEVEALSRYIDEAKQELTELRPDEIRDEHLPKATDELEAIVGATEQATNTILESMETLEEVAENLDEATGDKITGAVTQVYEACNFQDITGQRITKVVKALQEIENKVDQMLEAFGEEAARQRRERKEESTSDKPAEAGATSEADLLNGPSDDQDSVSQEDIDRLLAGFD
ncbi:chemotaxis protein CheZ [Limimonas halophila]|uniref:Chemotaxis protein CheZ n=1 Tax=Limimonas halophila TaxID=1082479 RepID=A0A1G7Q674_9PROT|nr:protein phosphatase CheZ [Limimonas halophila]SDF93994.1 chemotaxis protein CheZ [Limimonas halophila]